ncbi:hypothetical protein ACFQ2M_07205 [Kitasatospora saccharophila]|uniref:hypothetical protein n=1 Tax=Kitasatospora saccharophila TaxID=407973 RepID=UPI00362D1F3B
MLDRHPEPGELRTLAMLVRGQADRVDDADDELRRLAAYAISRLERTRNGDHRDARSSGLLRTLASDIETLAARYALSVEHLGRDLHTYREAAERSTGTEQPSRVQAAQVRSSTTTAPNTPLTTAAPGTHPLPARHRDEGRPSPLSRANTTRRQRTWEPGISALSTTTTPESSPTTSATPDRIAEAPLSKSA